MHIFFSGIGGTAIGPLALIARQAGHQVSGSDKQDSQYIHYLRNKGLNDIHIGQTYEQLAEIHDQKPIDWLVYTSALTLENPDSPELRFCTEQGIKTSKRDELLNQIIKDKNLKLVAIAGTHGKTTTTAMVIWLFNQLGLPISYSVGAKIPFGDMGQYQQDSQYFVYECDEFDRNFLSFEPHISLITGVTWDHHELFPTRENYKQAFLEFINQSKHTIIWREDAEYLNLSESPDLSIQDTSIQQIDDIKLAGFYNRLDAWLAIQGTAQETSNSIEHLIEIINHFPGLQRRMEQIIPNLYSDYAHTPEKIRGGLNVALELADKNNQQVIVVYEPLTNRRQHFIINEYKDCFNGASHVYWVPSYLAREDPSQRIIPSEELISHLEDPTIASVAKIDNYLKSIIQDHLSAGDMVVCMAGGSGSSLDEWIRNEFVKSV